MPNVTLDTQKVNWDELRRQKEVLVELTRDDHLEQSDLQALDGIIGLLDYIQDQTAKALGEKAVFGDLTAQEVVEGKDLKVGDRIQFADAAWAILRVVEAGCRHPGGPGVFRNVIMGNGNGHSLFDGEYYRRRTDGVFVLVGSIMDQEDK